MKKIALLSCDSLEGFVCYDDLLKKPFADAGYEVEVVPWKSEVDWGKFEAVIVRSTWDYQDDPDRFLKVLSCIDSSSARLENSLELMKWNLNKNYLKDLHDRGVFIIPSEFASDYNHDLALSLFSKYGCQEIIIKPCVSANSDDTFRFDVGALELDKENLTGLFDARSHMYQPFIPSVVDTGEYSLFYFGGEFSHAILKTPKSGDFRVQEEHGGILKRVEPEKKMAEIGNSVVSALNPMPLYARVDLVSLSDSWALMEVELIEPSLYFNLDSESTQRFVKAYKNIIAGPSKELF